MLKKINKVQNILNEAQIEEEYEQNFFDKWAHGNV